VADIRTTNSRRLSSAAHLGFSNHDFFQNFKVFLRKCYQKLIEGSLHKFSGPLHCAISQLLWFKNQKLLFAWFTCTPRSLNGSLLYISIVSEQLPCSPARWRSAPWQCGTKRRHASLSLGKATRRNNREKNAIFENVSARQKIQRRAGDLGEIAHVYFQRGL